MKKLLICLFSFLLWPIFGQDIFWDQEVLLDSGALGKFEIVQNQSLLGIVSSDVADYHEHNRFFNLYFSYSLDKDHWTGKKRLISNAYSHNKLGIDFSAVLDQEGNLYICYRENANRLMITRFDRQYLETGRFQPRVIRQINSKNIIYLPQIRVDHNNELHILYSINEQHQNKVYYLKLSSKNQVINESMIGSTLLSPLNPVIQIGKEKIYIIYQAKSSQIGEGIIYNIYLSSSEDQGKTWQEQILVHSEDFNNQKPFVLFQDQICHLAFEREDENFISHIYYKKIDFATGKQGPLIQVSDLISEAHSVQLVMIDGLLTAFWYDGTKGSFQNYYRQLIDDANTPIKAVKLQSGRTIINRVTSFQGQPIYFWLQDQKVKNFYSIKGDHYVKKPTLRIKEFKSGQTATNQTSLTLTWNKIVDISGTKGYKILVSTDKNETITEQQILLYHTVQSKKIDFLKEGTYYARIKAYDNAGNESQAEIIRFTVDQTPPLPPQFIEPEYDEDLTLTTNSPLIQWQEGPEKLAAYKIFTRLIFTDPLSLPDPDLLERHKKESHFKFLKKTDQKQIQLNDIDNGHLLLGLIGYDEAGNASPIHWKTFALNDYQAKTYVSYVSVQNNKADNQDDSRQQLNIYGRGFSVNGKIEAVILDRDRRFPYDYVLDRSHFKVNQDRKISNLSIENIEDGFYYLAVRHPERGIAYYSRKMYFESRWLFQPLPEQILQFGQFKIIDQEINGTTLVLIGGAVIWLLILFILLLSIIRIHLKKRDINRIFKELDEIRADLSRQEYQTKKEVTMKIKISLTFKYAILILLLVILIVSASSFTLSFFALTNEKRNLANEIKNKVLLITRNFQTTINDVITLEKGQSAAVDQTDNVSILPNIGFALFRFEEGSTFYINYGKEEKVIFSDFDLEILDSAEKEQVIKDLIYNDRNRQFLDHYKQNYSIEQIKILPDFHADHLRNYYVIVAPIYNTLDQEFAGEIAIGYSFEKTLELLRKETLILIKTTLIVTALAILLSVLGAFILATSTIRPIKKMYRHVNVISTTDDYEKLVGTENEKLEIKTGDEISILASSINDMTHKLIEKAKADKQMLLGKEIQKKFIPLEPHETDYIDIYGFYEGAKGVSGDYFDFKKLDENHYAFIICDVAGKAVPAALIMVQISTIFHAYFSHFKMGKDKLETVTIVNQINDTVAERGFQGRFAAILVMIFNVKTGKVLMTNAGYTQLLVYRNQKKQSEWIKLNENAGAAGVFPSFMLPHPYLQEHATIEKGDIIFLFTDGIEESRNGKVIKTESGDEHPEEFGLERIKLNIDQTTVKKPERIIKNLMKSEKEFRGELEQYDDLTLLAVMRK